MEFNSPSEKIKLMRKRFRVNQAELEGINMTRAFISMMESGRRNVSKSSSKLLAEKFNKIANRISVNLNLDDEYFSRTPKEDAIYYCKEELNKDPNHDKLEELIEISEDFELDDLQAEVYKLQGEKYYKEKDYKEAFFHFRKALGKYKELRDKKSQVRIYQLLGICKSRREEHDDAIHYYKEAIAYAREENDKRVFYKGNYNLALSYMLTQQYDKSLERLDQIINSKEDEVDFDILVDAKILKGYELDNIGRGKEAIDEDLSLIDILKGKDDESLSMAYNNIAEAYYKIGDYTKSLKYVDEAQRLKVKVNKPMLSQTLNTKGKVLFKTGFYQESILILGLAIDLAEEYKRFDYLLESCKDLITVYESTNDYQSIQDLMNRLLEILDTNDVKSGKAYAVLKLAEVSAKLDNSSETISYLNKLEILLQ
ncbi:helix-turn-helix transcriptional regulator [Clostridium folliculivorans]|uniref:Transcriptional regulator n=1 Tax=Clostridium folliculivorans TaxID=2886038 RepID=A0A9W5Y0A0_9CLOT|nr:helix-turn-helix transcriptional regulator [Clostridium folliculivorans]GKU24162.1 transcriptional regulator [Clostridium folliculivorans]GKU30267.1 transcriptional regulator [Clostridium folliculivorans]